MTDINNEGTPKVFADLPPEVVSNILSYLPYANFKATRLVNSQWYEASLAFELIDKEVLVYPSGNEFQETFEKSRRDYLHVKVVEGKRNVWLTEKFWTLVRPKLRSLYLEECNITEDEISELLCNCPMLKSLQFELCNFYDNQLPKKYKKNIEPELIKLKFVGLTYYPYDDIDVYLKVVDWAPNLEMLTLSEFQYSDGSSSHILAKHVETFFERNRDRNINISVNFRLKISDRVDMLRLVSSCPSIRFQGLEMGGSVDDWNSHLFEHCNSLQRLEVTVAVDDDALKNISNELSRLKHLVLRDCSNVINGFEKLASLTNLKSLSLWKCSQIKAETIRTGLCPRINRTLRNFDLSGLVNVPEECFVELARCHPHVKELEIRDCSINLEGVRAIADYQESITNLRLVGCRNVSDDALYQISRLKDLKRLELTRTNVSGAPFNEGLVLPVLRSICLNDTEVSEKSVRCLIKTHKILRDLWIWRCQFDMDNLQDILSSKPQLICHPEWSKMPF